MTAALPNLCLEGKKATVSMPDDGLSKHSGLTSDTSKEKGAKVMPPDAGEERSLPLDVEKCTSEEGY